MNRILIISGDIVDENMGGMGVRYWEIAHALAPHCNVTLAIPNTTSLTSEKIRIIQFDLEHDNLEAEARQAEVIILQGFILHFHPYLKDLNIPIAIDLYIPFLLESLVWHDHDDWNQWIPAYEEYLRVQTELLRVGDFFFCASERQRDYWLGWLHAQKRINPHTYHNDPTLRALIDVVPFGIPDDPPVHTKDVLRGVHPAINKDSRLILWSGGIWDWLDPLTVIRAMPAVLAQCPEARLYFMGTIHPNAKVGGMGMPEKAVALSKELGLFDKTVIFGNWAPYKERMNFLLEADLGVVAYQDHIETHFSFRTRVLDCIWAGLPVVTTGGDTLAEVLQKNQLGIAVEAGRDSDIAQAILAVISGSEHPVNFNQIKKIQAQYAWVNAVNPLLSFCLSPHFGIDKGQYLTELERTVKAKDAFLQQVIVDKDKFYSDTIQQLEKERGSRLGRSLLHFTNNIRGFLKK